MKCCDLKSVTTEDFTTMKSRAKFSRYRSPHLVIIFNMRISYVSRSSLTITALILNKALDLKL